MKDGDLLNCNQRSEKPDDFKMFPDLSAQLDTKNTLFHTKDGRCFKNISMEGNLEKVHDGYEYRVTVHLDDPKEWDCTELMFFGTNDIAQLETFFFKGTHHMTFKNLRDADIVDLQGAGMGVFVFCEGIADTFTSVFKTLKMFLGGLTAHPDWPIIGSHTTAWMRAENKKFLKERMGWELEERKVQNIDIDKNLVESGDYFPIFRLDGLD